MALCSRQVSLLSHELKAPVSAVEGYLQMMIDGIITDEAVRGQILQRCIDRLGRMRTLIDDLLDMSMIVGGQRRRELTQVDLNALAQHALATSQPAAANAQVLVALHGQAVLEADSLEMEIILNNLISNAIKYNRPGGRVDVYLELAADVVTIRVADTGIGLAEQDKHRLFQEFGRIKSGRTRDIPGSGLGLAIVQRLAIGYGGRAEVDSTPGEGSCFTVYLPARQA